MKNRFSFDVIQRQGIRLRPVTVELQRTYVVQFPTSELVVTLQVVDHVAFLVVKDRPLQRNQLSELHTAHPADVDGSLEAKAEGMALSLSPLFFFHHSSVDQQRCPAAFPMATDDGQVFDMKPVRVAIQACVVPDR